MPDIAPSQTARITTLLRALGQGEKAALGELRPLVQEQLRQLARRHLSRDAGGRTLNAVALVNEAFLRLANDDKVAWQNRARFFAVSAPAMRQILADYARTRRSHGSTDAAGPRAIPLDELEVAAGMTGDEAQRLLALDATIARLAAEDATAGRLVELRYFTGATEDEAAQALEISPAAARRRWAFAKAWLLRDQGRDLPS